MIFLDAPRHPCRMSQDGRLKSVTVHGFQKRYDLEKYYTFILKVTRQSQPDPAYLFRSYKEFSEFHQKLCMHYPLAKLHRYVFFRIYLITSYID